MMIVCICKNWSEDQIRTTCAIYGISTIQDLQDYTNIGSQCGSCLEFAEMVVKETIAGEYESSTVGS